MTLLTKHGLSAMEHYVFESATKSQLSLRFFNYVISGYQQKAKWLIAFIDIAPYDSTEFHCAISYTLFVFHKKS